MIIIFFVTLNIILLTLNSYVLCNNISNNTTIIPKQPPQDGIKSTEPTIIGPSPYTPIYTPIVNTKLGIPYVKVCVDTKDTEVMWAPVSEATGYDIEINGSIHKNVSVLTMDNGINIYNQPTSRIVYLASRLQSNETRTYRVRAEKGLNVVGGWSNLVTVKGILDTPTNIKAIVINKSVSLSWDPVVGATKYEIVKDTNNYIPTTNCSYTDTDVYEGQSHTYAVIAENDFTESRDSETVNVTIVSSAPPQNFRATSINATSISLAWEAAKYRSDEYEIEVDGKINPSIMNNYVASQLQPNTQHIFRVRTKYGTNFSDWSSPISVVTSGLSCPPNMKYTPGSNLLNLNWDAVDGATSYDVEIDGVNNSNITTSNSYAVSNLQPNTQHSIRVRARNGSLVSDWSPMLTAWTEDYGNDQNNAYAINTYSLKGDINYANDVDYFKITPCITGKYAIKSTGTTNVVACLYDSNGNQLASTNNSLVPNFRLIYNLNAGQTYYFKVSGKDSSTTGLYNLEITGPRQYFYDTVLHHLDYVNLPLGGTLKYVYDNNGNLKQIIKK